MPRRTLRLSPKLSLPLDAITRTFGVFGQRGTGKSTTGAVLVEQAILVGGRAVVLDPTGVWYGLTREGTGPGLPGVVLGGEFGDAPLERGSGKLVAEFVIGSEYALIVLDMKLMRKHERQKFAMEFLETLYHDNRDPLLVVFDEAAQFAPTHMREGGDVPRLLGAVEDLVKLGRSRGLGAVMIEQRIATLNANVREQIETLVAHRLVGPLDRKALREWVAAQGEPEREAEALELIPKLDKGRALLWSPAFLRFFGVIDVNNATTYDSRATPEVGKKRKALTRRAPVDLDTLREQMAAAIIEAEDRDPTKLRAEVERLRSKLEAAERLADERAAMLADRPPDTVEVQVPILSEDDLAELNGLVHKVEESQAEADSAAERLRAVLDPLASNVREELRRRTLQAARPVAPPRLRSTSQRSAPHAVTSGRKNVAETSRAVGSAPEAAPDTGASDGASTNGSLGSSARRFLSTLARYYPMPLTVGQLGVLSQRKTRGGSFNTAMRQLRDGGLVVDAGDGLVLTERGMAEAGVAPKVMTLDDWREVLPVASREILDVLVEHHDLPIEEAAELVGRAPRGGSWNTAIKMLVTAGLVEKMGSRLVLRDEVAAYA